MFCGRELVQQSLLIKHTLKHFYEIMSVLVRMFERREAFSLNPATLYGNSFEIWRFLVDMRRPLVDFVARLAIRACDLKQARCQRSVRHRPSPGRTTRAFWRRSCLEKVPTRLSILLVLVQTRSIVPLTGNVGGGAGAGDRAGADFCRTRCWCRALMRSKTVDRRASMGSDGDGGPGREAGA